MKSLKTIAFVSFILLATTTLVFASWWNPFSWGFFTKNTVVITKQSTDHTVDEKNKKADLVSVNTEYTQSDFTWVIQDMGDTGKLGESHNKVMLQVHDSKKEDIGDYYMNCSEQAISYYKGSTKISKSVICWWAGSGKEIAVFLENGKYLVKVADIDEGNPNIKLPPIEFKTVFEIKK